LAPSRRAPRPRSARKPFSISNGRDCLQQLERFSIAAALEEMAELRIDVWWEGLFQALDSFRDNAKPFGVLLPIASTLFVRDDREAIAKSGGKLD
jgi:hypothetical protein